MNTCGGKHRPSGLGLPLFVCCSTSLKKLRDVPNLEHFNGWTWRVSWDRCEVVCVRVHVRACVCILLCLKYLIFNYYLQWMK